jgi:hypothetical protein
MHHTRVSFLTLFLTAAFAYGEPSPTDVVIGNLQNKPDDPALLVLIKSTIPSVSNANDKCRLGVVYALGCLASGNIAEGLTVRRQVLKAFPTNELASMLAESRIMEKCKSCTGGQVQVACKTCQGKSVCLKCNGTKQQEIVGFDGMRTVKCMLCAGTGNCKTCNGTGMVGAPCPDCRGASSLVSPILVQTTYLHVLGVSPPPPKPDTPTSPVSPEKTEVQRAIKAARLQVQQSPLLAKYPISAADIKSCHGPNLTSVQKEEAVKELLPRGIQENSYSCLFFLPLPAGITYRVMNVSKKEGRIHLLLTSSPSNEPVVDGAMTPGTVLTQIEEVLCAPLQGFLRNPEVIVPGTNTAFLAVKINQIVTSGSWIVPVSLNTMLGAANFYAPPGVYRSEAELYELRGISAN